MEISDLTVHRAVTHSSGVSWGAVIGGAFVTAALSLILLALGAGFGLSAISPWPGASISATTVGTVGLIWLVVTEVISSSMGGYLTGRLRTGWHPLHTDEVHFRDTANGFLAWAVAVVVTAAFLGSAATSMAGTVNETSNRETAGTAYFVDRLFRSGNPSGPAAETTVRAEAGRIVARVLQGGNGTSADTAWLGELVAAKTGLSPADAEKRVSGTMAEARQAVDGLRRVTARVLLWTFLALLIGAFCASYAATLGGRQRDRVQVL
jgi:hypothetical protein